ncbi:hypothetical protein E5161_19795 [Cohnella pontilimi]|uniref:Aromatic acid exporter family member 1 n=1 Tax=Cohnella pontilimi TaxID=2564100 RepID=A0A4U0F7F2_9BACL|nr:aromatic acid exporter family protein [Cohnella pontilimi]TJY38902.1 hypothetical protein E5161_19795 [Cohnella pontilimi]
MKNFVNRLIPSTRTCKAVLAAVLSWVIASRTGAEHPFFAPLAAILCLQVTVEKSIRMGFQRMLGILVGVILASIFVHAFGTHWWSLALLLLIGLTIGQAFRLPQYTNMQIGTSALLVLTIGTDASYGIDRIVETLIGAAVAIVVNMTVLPPDYSRRAEASLRRAASNLAAYYRLLSEWIGDGAPEENVREVGHTVLSLAEALKDAMSKLEQAMHALKFSPFTQRRRQRLEYLRKLLNTLMLGCMHGVELQRLLFEASGTDGFEDRDRDRWVRFLSDFAEYVETWREEAISGNRPEPMRLIKEFESAAMTAEDYMSASLAETHCLLRNFCSDDNTEERMFPVARVAFGKVSDGKSRAHDLFES